MKLTDVEETSLGKRFNFKSFGYLSWMDIDKNGKVLDGTFRVGSEPYLKQLKLVEKYYK